MKESEKLKKTFPTDLQSEIGEYKYSNTRKTPHPESLARHPKDGDGVILHPQNR